jgi:hypothetical protein
VLPEIDFAFLDELCAFAVCKVGLQSGELEIN